MEQYVAELKHLSKEEGKSLLKTLNKFPTLFGGGLGTLNVKPIHLELKSDAKSYHGKPFPIPQSLYKVTKKEIERLSKIGVPEANSNSERGAPSFAQPKKTGGVRILTDFRKLNEAIKKKPFPLPKISE